MKQQSFIPNSSRREHGGSLLVGRRRTRRPLSPKKPLHLVLRSDFAVGSRNLLKHQQLILRVLAKSARRFRIRIYEKAIVSNHIHLLVRGRSRRDLQNFFRVFAGHTAQQILECFPIRPGEKPKPGGAPIQSGNRRGKTRESENKFWQTRVYSRVVTWGREYLTVKRYVVRNSLEALGLIAYQVRKKRSNERVRNTS